MSPWSVAIVAVYVLVGSMHCFGAAVNVLTGDGAPLGRRALAGAVGERRRGGRRAGGRRGRRRARRRRRRRGRRGHRRRRARGVVVAVAVDEPRQHEDEDQQGDGGAAADEHPLGEPLARDLLGLLLVLQLPVGLLTLALVRTHEGGRLPAGRDGTGAGHSGWASAGSGPWPVWNRPPNADRAGRHGEPHPGQVREVVVEGPAVAAQGAQDAGVRHDDRQSAVGGRRHVLEGGHDAAHQRRPPARSPAVAARRPGSRASRPRSRPRSDPATGRRRPPAGVRR